MWEHTEEQPFEAAAKLYADGHNGDNRRELILALQGRARNGDFKCGWGNFACLPIIKGQRDLHLAGRRRAFDTNRVVEPAASATMFQHGLNANRPTARLLVGKFKHRGRVNVLGDRVVHIA